MGWGRKHIEDHPITLQGSYDDPSRKLKGIKLTYDQALANYSCRKCKAWMGCNRCIDDVASLICRNCQDWANNISESVHGRLVRGEESEEAWKIVKMRETGKITDDDCDEFFRRLFRR